ncbi:MAG: DNA primase [Deltaproteobacteria bacterium]|nr:DNA primase [Deltaproteobacteria bacterium]
MAERIPEATLAEIRARVSIVEVISAHVALRKAGRNYTGLCPFHGEKTPSFSVNEEGGFFHCFGCGVGGNAFTFLSRVEGITFPEAVRRLAAKAGVALPQAERDPQAQERARLYRINDIAATYFQRCLWGNIGESARRYVEERGINKDIAERFRLGFAPPGRDGLVRFLTMQKAPLDKAASLGLIGKLDDGRFYDKFRYRLMFPITDIVGRIVGFGGRLMPMAQAQTTNNGQTRTLPKYLNSPESAIYKKSTLLYGLFQAKDAMKKNGRAILVEGYIDLLALVQNGHEETVAVSGTALGAAQLKALHNFIPEVYILFDGDEAGRKAATRAFPLCVEAELRGRGVFLPQGEDPDTFARKHGEDKLRELIDHAEPLEDFYFARHAPQPGATAFQRAQAAREAMGVLKTMTDVVARGALLTQIAQRFGVSEEELRRTATMQDSNRSAGPKSPVVPVRQEPQNAIATAETELLQLMLVDRHAALHVAQEGIIPAFQHWAHLATEVVSAWQNSDMLDLGDFLGRLPKSVADRVTRMYAGASNDREIEARQQMLLDCIAKIRNVQKRAERDRLRQELREAEQRGNEEELRTRLQHLQRRDKQE